MKFKVGIDIVENKRLKKKLKNERFLNWLLSSNEQKKFQQFKSVKKKLSFICGRWAAKEAIFKALNCQNLLFKNFDIYYLDNAPKLQILKAKNQNYDLELSISHEKKYSVAVVIVFLK